MGPMADAASSVRDRFVERLGHLPPRPPAVPTVDRTLVLDEVAFERWRIPGPCGPIPAWLLLPAGAGPRPPVVLALHQHGRQFEVGKSLVTGLVGDGTGAYGLAAARAGFAVLAPDLPGFEDQRPPLAERKANYALQGETYERFLAATALIQGETLQGRMLSELAACIDALERDDRVDAGRLGILGQSYGGQQAIFGMLFEPRLRAGVASCGFSLVRLLIERRISHNLALYVPGLLPDLDLDTLLPAIAPRPLTVIAGRHDAIFPVDGVEIVEAAARRAWEAAGAPDALRFRYHDGPHALPADALAEALEWLQRVL